MKLAFLLLSALECSAIGIVYHSQRQSSHHSRNKRSAELSNETVIAPLLDVVAGGFVEHLPTAKMSRSLPTNLLEGFKHITPPIVFAILSEASSAAGKGDTAKFSVLCRYAACHGQHDAKCDKVCDEISPKIDPNFFEHKIGTLKRIDAAKDIKDWQKKCTLFCGTNDCGKECSALSATHFIFENRKEYELEFNELMERLRTYAKQIPVSSLTGYKHIDAKSIIKETSDAGQKGGDEEIARYAVLCRKLTCHDGGNECKSACNAIAMKVDHKAYESHVGTFKSTDTSLDVDTCIKRCSLFCGKNDCSKDCGVICSAHFSYPTRKEYEAEFFDLMQRLRV